MLIGNLCNGFPFLCCSEVFFDVRDAPGSVSCNLKKKFCGYLLHCMCGNKDYLSLGFPKDSTPMDKSLLLAAILFIDYTFLEKYTE